MLSHLGMAPAERRPYPIHISRGQRPRLFHLQFARIHEFLNEKTPQIPAVIARASLRTYVCLEMLLLYFVGYCAYPQNATLQTFMYIECLTTLMQKSY